MKLKDNYSLESYDQPRQHIMKVTKLYYESYENVKAYYESYDQPRQHIKKQRHYFTRLWFFQ